MGGVRKPDRTVKFRFNPKVHGARDPVLMHPVFLGPTPSKEKTPRKESLYRTLKYKSLS